MIYRKFIEEGLLLSSSPVDKQTFIIKWRPYLRNPEAFKRYRPLSRLELTEFYCCCKIIEEFEKSTDVSFVDSVKMVPPHVYKDLPFVQQIASSDEEMVTLIKERTMKKMEKVNTVDAVIFAHGDLSVYKKARLAIILLRENLTNEVVKE